MYVTKNCYRFEPEKVEDRDVATVELHLKREGGASAAQSSRISVGTPKNSTAAMSKTGEELKEELVEKVRFARTYKTAEKLQDYNWIQSREDDYMLSHLSSVRANLLLPKTLGLVRIKHEDSTRAPSPKNLRLITLQNKKFGDSYANTVSCAIKALTHKQDHLKSLNLRDNRLTEEGVLDIIESVADQAEEIDLSYNSLLGESSFQQITMYMGSYNSKLRILKLESTHINERHIDILSNQLQYCKFLSQLDLSQNALTSRAGVHIENLVQRCHELKELYLHFNRINSEGGLLILEAVRKSGTLRVLDLSHNCLGLGLQRHEFADSFGRLILASEEENLLHLDLSYNQLDDANKIKDFIKPNRTIIGFHFSGNGFYVSPEGYIKRMPEEECEVIVNRPRRIHGVSFTGENEYLHRQLFGEHLEFDRGDNCWLCEGWVEHTFTWGYNSGELRNKETLFLHTELDGYKPLRMKQEEGGGIRGVFYMMRMIPPKTELKYYFSEDGRHTITLARDQPRLILKTKVACYSERKRRSQRERKSARARNRFGEYDEAEEEGGGEEGDLVGQQDHDYLAENSDGEEGPTVWLSELNYIEKEREAGLVDENYIVEGQVRPRVKYEGAFGSKVSQKNSRWSVPVSFWRDFKFDDIHVLNNCFEFDWKSSRIMSIVKTADSQAKCKKILRDIYPQLRNTYRYYAALSARQGVPCIAMNVFSEFVKETNIVDDQLLKLSDVDLKFIACNASANKIRKSPMNPDKALVRYQFMEIVVRLAEDKYIRNEVLKKHEEAIQQLLDDGYAKALEKIEDAELWRDEIFWIEENDRCIKYYMPVLKSVYDLYAEKKKKNAKQYSNNKTIVLDEFREIVLHCNLTSELFNERDINACFGLSIMTQVDELSQDRHTQMSFIEFVEGVARVAEKSIIYKHSEVLHYMKDSAIKINLQRAVQEVFANNLAHLERDHKQPQLELKYKMETIYFIFYHFIGEENLRETFTFPNQSIFDKNDM